jgi:lipoprotein-anchoring transpeptidase ErfK/SrfK
MFVPRFVPPIVPLCLLLLATPACGQRTTPAKADGAPRGAARADGAARAAVRASGPAQAGPPVAADPKPTSEPAVVAGIFPPDVRSLRLKKSVVAYSEADDKSRPRGTIAGETRVRWLAAKPGRGCSGANRWIEIDEGAWVCDRNLEPTTREPSGRELPRIPQGKLIPGDFATIDLPKSEKKAEGAQPYGYRSVKDIEAAASQPTGGAWKCMLQKPSLAVKGKSYWRTDCNGMIFDARFVRRMDPSKWEGVKLDEAKLELPIVFSAPPKADTTSAPGGGKKVRTLKGRTALRVLEVKVVKERGKGRPPVRAYRVGENEWLASPLANLVEKSAPPTGVRGDEKWVDINTDEQVLVAYEGPKPVFATLISSGKEHGAKGKDPTPTVPGTYRIYHKFAETKMSGMSGTDEAYWVSKVPWTQYFSGDFALHGAYWHNGFGRTASHGCVNLAPKDARFLYFWTDPPVPLGWSMKAADTAHPGSVVRVRNQRAPDPEFKGYAKRVLRLRQGQPVGDGKPDEATEAPAIPVGPGESGRDTP